MKRKLYITAVLVWMVGVCLFSRQSIAAARAALALCANALVPSLFVFFVLSGLLMRLGFAQILQQKTAWLLRPLFAVNGSGASALLLGWISGYPVGTVCVKELYQSGRISRTEAERLLAFCNTTGPVFVLSAVGGAMLGELKAGWLLYSCHIAAALTVGLLFRFYKPTQCPSADRRIEFSSVSLTTALPNSIRAAVKNVLYVCGITVVFSVLLSFLPDRPLVRGIFELTNGCAAVCALRLPYAHKLGLLSVILGFGGISVHMQIAGILSDCDLSIKTCVAGKALQAVLSYIYLYLII